MHDAGTSLGRERLIAAVEGRAGDWFGADRDYPAAWEPGGQDFLSPALSEADLMRRVLPTGEFPSWLAGFLPGLAESAPETLFTPAEVRDGTDGKQGHLYGLNLSRAWQFRLIAADLPAGDRRVPALCATAERHLAASLPHVSGKGFVTDHWLATYAFLALSA